MSYSGGWCDFANQHRGMDSGPFGYPAGTTGQNKPIVFVDHRMGGYKRTLDNDQWRHENWVGVHFGIGRDGSIDQYTSIFDASWGNGVAGSRTKYDRSNPKLAYLETLGTWITVPYAGTTANALVSGNTNVVNCHSISTEHEDATLDQPWTQEMIEADIKVKRWCLISLALSGIPMEISLDSLVGHFQIDAVNRSNCPGDYWPKIQIFNGMEEKLTPQQMQEIKNYMDIKFIQLIGFLRDHGVVKLQ